MWHLARKLEQRPKKRGDSNYMGEAEKLQKALELTLSAGYQLDKEAFEFLTLVMATEDPFEVMNRAIERLREQDQRPFFIERKFLEQMLETEQRAEEVAVAPLEEPPQPLMEPEGSRITGGKTAFRPYAKDVDSSINIIDDPGARLSSSGTMNGYLEYFQDRFEQTEKLLRQRIDVKSATSIIEALRAQPGNRLKIIVMITEKRESKQKTILMVEDLTSSMTALVPLDASPDLQRRARCLLLDQVVCLSVAKTRSNLFIVEDIVLPDVPQRTPHRASIPVYAVLTSDMHVGSTKFTREAFDRFILWLNGKYGNPKEREIASHVKYVVIAGDIVDGIGVYPNQMKELALKDVHKQYRLASKYLEQIPDYIEVLVTPGNHDAPRKALPQPSIADTFLETLQESRAMHSLGSPCTLTIHEVEFLVFHGRSLDDVISTVPNMSHSHPEQAMRLLLQSRHMAPIYGGKTPISPENRDPLVIQRVPDIFHAGHVHALECSNYRGVTIVNSGCWQEQTGYMQRNGFMPTPAKVPVVNLQSMEVMVVPFV